MTAPPPTADPDSGGFAWQGATTLVDGDVLVQNDRGEIVLVKANPEKYEELARAQPLGGQCC